MNETEIWQRIYQALDDGDYETMVALLRPLAEKGDAEAQFRLGYRYDNGEGVAQDYAQAIYWYEQSAMQNYAGAECNLGWLYENGNGVSQDFYKAFAWYERSARHGSVWGQVNLADLYEHGNGVAQDYAAAFAWYEKAALQDNGWAQLKLGVFYETGLGVAADESRARQWLEKAAMQGNAEAARRLARFYEDGGAIFADGLRLAGSTPRYLGIPPQMLPRVAAVFPALQAEKNALWQQAFAAHQAGDRLTAFALMRELAEDGDADAHYLLALMYLDGTLIVSDHYPARAALYEVKNEREFVARGHLAQIRYWTEKTHDPLRLMESGSYTREILKKLAAEGDAPAQNFLGCIYAANKRNIFADDPKATECFAEAAAQNDAMGQFNLALAYESGEDDHCDWAQAHNYYEKAAVQDFAPAKFRLALQYLHGKGVARDEAQAWFAQAAAGGNIRAQYRLGIRYCDEARRLYQYHVKAKVCDSARLWLVQAAIQGDGAAQRALGVMFANRDYGVPDRVLANYWNDAAQWANAPVADPPGAVQRDSTVAAVDSRHITAYRSAARQGDAAAQYALGVLYQAGEVVPQGFAQAFQWYERAAQQHYAPAQLALGILFEYGKGVAANAARAVQYYEQAALQGHPVAQYRLALHYRDGEGVAQDTAKAREWLARAAEQDNPAAARTLAALSA